MYLNMHLRKVLYYRPHAFGKLLDQLTCACTRNNHTNCHVRKIPMLLTTPIYYVNSVPHIGHLYTAVLADALTRWHRLQDSNIIFTTGTDEHGLKIQQAASKHGKEPLEFCNEISTKFKDLFDVAGVGYSDFIRTTEPRHKAAVHSLWNRLSEQGHIYKGIYEGWYCTSDETFVSEQDITEATNDDGSVVKISKESGHPVEWVKEDNYMFRLSEFRPQLIEWLDKKVIIPSHPYEAAVRDFVNGHLEDLSVSRQRERLNWGIPVPGDETQTIYVWLDALTNYLTVCGYPADNHSWHTAYHLVGKDILKFHAVFWPAFLIAAGLQPPEKIFCHAHWLKDYKKMSKSIGNVVDPFASIDKYSADGLRYFLLREGVPHSDGNFSEEKIVDCLNSELVNTLGNLLSRCTGTKVNPLQVVPKFHEADWNHSSDADDRAMWDKLNSVADTVSNHFNNFEIYQAITAVMSQLRDTNGFIQKHEPWELARNSSQQAWLDTVLHVSLHTLRICGILLQPVIPELSVKLLDRLNIPANQRTWKHAVRYSGHNSEVISLGSGSSVIMKRLK